MELEEEYDILGRPNGDKIKSPNCGSYSSWD